MSFLEIASLSAQPESLTRRPSERVVSSHPSGHARVDGGFFFSGLHVKRVNESRRNTKVNATQAERNVRIYMHVHDLRLPSVLTVSFLRWDLRVAAGARGPVGGGGLTPVGHAGLHIRHCATRGGGYTSCICNAVPASRGDAQVHPHDASIRVVPTRAVLHTDGRGASVCGGRRDALYRPAADSA